MHVPLFDSYLSTLLPGGEKLEGGRGMQHGGGGGREGGMQLRMAIGKGWQEWEEGGNKGEARRRHVGQGEEGVIKSRGRYLAGKESMLGLYTF